MRHMRTLVGFAAPLLLTTAGLTLAGPVAHAEPVTAEPVLGTVSGTITAANRAVGRGWVELSPLSGSGSSQYVVISRGGAKTFSAAVPAGQYRASFYGSTEVLPEYFGGGVWRLPSETTNLTVTEGGSVTHDFAYPAMSEVSGKVTSGGVAEVTGFVSFYRWDAATAAFGRLAGASVDARGGYVVPSLPDGSYTARFTRDSDVPSGYEEKWLGGSATIPEGPTSAGVFTIAGADLVKSFEFDGLSPAPVATTAPAIPATTVVGTTLTVAPGTWTENPALTYQWLRNGVAIAGASTAAYTVLPIDAGQSLSVVVGATQVGNHAGGATSNVSVVAKHVSKTTAAQKLVKGKLAVAVAATGHVPTGTVTVAIGKRVLGKGTLVAGKVLVKLPAKDLKKGKNKLSVTYSGDAAAAASSAVVSVKVGDTGKKKNGNGKGKGNKK